MAIVSETNLKWRAITSYPKYEMSYLTDPIRFITKPMSIRVSRRFITLEEDKSLLEELQNVSLEVLKKCNYSPKSFQVKYIWQDHIFSSLELQDGVTYVANLALICTFISRNVDTDEVILKFKLKHLKTVGVLDIIEY